MAKAIYTLVFSAISLAHILHGEQLVFPEGEVHSILCTAPDEDHFEINWGTGDGGFFENEGTFTVGDEEPATNGTSGRRVIFTTSPEVNGTTLRCVVINFRQPSDSPEPLEFTIIIQGTLPAPDVDYTIREDGSILFSWSPPFSHNITDVEPDISHYLVTIINTEDHHSVFTVNTTDTEYLLQSQDCQLPDYQVEIAAVNVVGVGDKYTSPPLTLDVVTVSNTATVILGGKTPEISFQLQFGRNCNKETSFDFQLMPTFTKQQLISISVMSQQQPTLTLQSGDIQLNELYDVTLRVDGTSTFQLSLSTFDVQNVEVRLINNEYEIICYFATGSKARGCRIVLTNDQEEEKEECNAQRLEGVGEAVIKATLPAGEYSLLVYDDDDDYMGQENPAYHTYVSSTSPDFHRIGCFPKASDLESSADPTSDSENGYKELTVVLSVVLPMVFIFTLLGIVGVVAVLVTRNRRVSKRRRHPESGESAANEYVERKSFLGKHSLSTTSESSGSHDSTQGLTEDSSLSDNRESSESQGSVESNTTTETELPPPSPAPTTNTHSSPNATTEPPNTTTHTHNFPNLPEATTDTQQTPNTAETETNNLTRSSGPVSGQSGVNQESSPHSTAPVGSRQRNYIQVEPEAGWNIQRPPDIKEDTALYATILLNATTERPNTTTHTHSSPTLPEATTDTQQTPNTAETETNNLTRSSGPVSGQSGVNQESSPHSTAPVGSRQRNYIQVEPEAGWNIQRPPDIKGDTVLYATIVPHPPINPQINTDNDNAL